MKPMLVSAALAGVLSVASSTPAQAQDMETPPAGKEKCYGVVKKGQNDCASANGKHACGGMAEKDNDPNEWKFVNEGECATLGGKTQPPAQPPKK